MQDTELTVDDGYLNDVAEYFEWQGKRLQDVANGYAAVMRRVTGQGIVRGRTAEALTQFAAYAEGLNQVIASTAMQARDAALAYVEEIDAQDRS